MASSLRLRERLADLREDRAERNRVKDKTQVFLGKIPRHVGSKKAAGQKGLALLVALKEVDAVLGGSASSNSDSGETCPVASFE